jgi:hypothetical protein
VLVLAVTLERTVVIDRDLDVAAALSGNPVTDRHGIVAVADRVGGACDRRRHQHGAGERDQGAEDDHQPASWRRDGHVASCLRVLAQTRACRYAGRVGSLPDQDNLGLE